MNWIDKHLYKCSKWMANRPQKQLKGILWFFLAIIALVSIGALLYEFNIIKGYNFWKALGSFFSPVPMYSMHNSYIRFLAYLFGTIVISGVLIAMFTNLIRTAGERYTNGTISFRFKNHILFLGYDEMMIGTLRQELKNDEERGEKNEYVIAVPNDVALIRNTIYQYIHKDQTKRVFVIQASRTNVDDLQEVVFVSDAKKIFIIGQPEEATHDANNLNCLGLIAAIIPCQPPLAPIPCYYYLRNQSTFYMIHRMGYKTENFKNYIVSAKLDYNEKSVESFIKACEPFNFNESIARHVLFGSKEHNEDTLQLNCAKKDPHLIIYGMTPMGTALLRDVLMTQHFPGRRLRVTMVDEKAKDEMHFLIGRHRPFFENCHYTYRNLDNLSQNFEHPAVLEFLDVDMEFIQGEVAHPELAQYLRNCIEQEHESLTIAICTNDSPKNIALAIYMPRQVFEAKVPIWVYQNGDNSMNAFVENDDVDNLYSSIRVFSPVNYGISDRKNSWQWQLAKNVSDDYAQRHPYEDNYRWEFSQPSIRWSSLYGAISKITMLRSIGKVSTPILLTKEEEQELALTEHNRWNTEKLLNGWEPSSSGKKTMFVHNKIVPYDQLDETSKEKDKEQIEVVRKKMNLDGKM